MILRGVLSLMSAEPDLKAKTMNILSKFHDEIFWLNRRALLNMASINTTFDIFQVLMGWLNTRALLNIKFISVTLLVSHDSIGWLNVVALSNILFMFLISVVTILSNGTGLD